MKLEIMAMGKLKDKRYRALMREYMGRLEHYIGGAESSLRPSSKTGLDVEAGLREEAEVFASRCGTHTVKIALDERGELLTSRHVAQKVSDWMTYGTRHVAFFIGSAHGLDPDFRRECDEVWALSKMTLPHEMARVLLAEQLYRALTIIRGEPYHK